MDTHSSESMGGYLHATLQMILSWDQATRERVLLEGRQLRLAGVPYLKWLYYMKYTTYYFLSNYQSTPILLGNTVTIFHVT